MNHVGDSGKILNQKCCFCGYIGMDRTRSAMVKGFVASEGYTRIDFACMRRDGLEDGIDLSG
jgi:hypothetical protein